MSAVAIASVPVTANSQSTDEIIQSIQSLESRNDPKCYATASRLEDFMFGTPLSFEARAEKNLLQRNFIADIWDSASKLRKGASAAKIAPIDIERALAPVMTFTVNEAGHHEVTFSDGQTLVVNSIDKRQYSSIAYSLRALLTVQQEALINGSSPSLMPLSPEAITAVKDASDLYTLSVLKIADTMARKQDLSEVPAVILTQVWADLGAYTLASANPALEAPEPAESEATSLAVTRGIIEQKVASYAVYNAISNPLFVRNLQVYFAKRRWPADSNEARQFRRDFTEGLIAQAVNFYTGAQGLAKSRDGQLIREADVHAYVQQALPHEANVYEDIIFFPHLPRAEQVIIEAYDIDAFRDSGIHWRYLQYAIDDTPSIILEADAFALELLTESIANVGVLMLRLAGEVSLNDARERLAATDIDAALKQIKSLTKKDAAAITAADNGNNRQPAQITSSEVTSSDDKGPAAPERSEAYFNDVTDQTGVEFMHRSSNWLNRQLRSYIEKDANTGISTIPPAFGGGGAAAGDVDNDGDVDILLVGGLGNALFINDGSGRFRNASQQWGLAWQRPDGYPGEPRQPLIADLDNDGHQDVVITYVDDTHRVYRNTGEEKFEDVSNTALLGGKGLVGGPATVFDANSDGLLDIYITYFGNYIKGVLPTLARRNTNGLPNQLFLNRGRFKFENVTERSGLGNIGWGQAVTHTDFTGDGLQDVIAGNDFGVNAYYRNNGDLTFTNISAELGTGKPSYTMGIGLADLNADSLPDVYISNIVTMNKDQKYVLPGADTPAVFDPENLANMRVIEANDLFLSNRDSNKSGKVAYQSSDAVQRGYAETGWSWGAEFFDADHDGDDDLYVLNGMNEFHVYSSDNPYYTDPNSEEAMRVYIPVSRKEQNVFFRNHGGKLNIDNDQSGLADIGNSRALLTVDIDNDGDLDLVVNNYHEQARVYRNEFGTGPVASTFISLIGNPEAGVNRDAIGTQVRAITHTGQQIWRELHGSGGYMSVQPKTLHLGVPAEQIHRVEITWPNGQRQMLTGPFSGSEIEISYTQ